MSLKLYKVTLKNLANSYVLANDPTEAYKTVRADLDKRDIGLTKHRVLDRIELLAEDVERPDCGTRVYVAGAEKYNDHIAKGQIPRTGKINPNKGPTGL